MDMLHARLGHLPKKLPRIRAELFHIATLSLGIERVHRQGAFAAAAGTAEDTHAIAWNLDVDTLQIMLCRAANGDIPRPIPIRGKSGRGDLPTGR